MEEVELNSKQEAPSCAMIIFFVCGHPVFQYSNDPGLFICDPGNTQLRSNHLISLDNRMPVLKSNSVWLILALLALLESAGGWTTCQIEYVRANTRFARLLSLLFKTSYWQIISIRNLYPIEITKRTLCRSSLPETKVS